jgi:pimeloyl-ACP methyl ester carboxylesterase
MLSFIWNNLEQKYIKKSYLCIDFLNCQRVSLLIVKKSFMKIRGGIFKLSVITALVIVFSYSCKKEDTAKTYSYFVSKKLLVEFKKDYITSMLDLASIQIPQIAAIKSHVVSDISVYRVVYKTTINGNEINASGLLCVPATPGDYPVLSFQNGTNTVYAAAPTESPSEYTHQFVETIASMGYIVLFADYPGFGESTQIPHPYLVKEPTVRSLVDFLYTAKEIGSSEFPGITFRNEYYLLGYSQGGWATFALDKALESDYASDFNVKGVSCGAGSYNIPMLLESTLNKQTYPVPAYLAYIVNAYTSYGQFTNPASDIFSATYASKISSLFNGQLSLDQIDTQLTTSVPDLLNPDFISGFETAAKYAPVMDALVNNSITAWHTLIPILFTHGEQDTQVDPVSTENMFNDMIAAGTSPDICKKTTVPNVDHGPGAIPCMLGGLLFLDNLKNSR